VYLLSRLWQNYDNPLFIDEGVYLWFAESTLNGDLVRGFGEGKPLIGWIIALPLALGVDPIWSARLPHILAGLIGLLAAMALAQNLAGRGAALLTGALSLLLPALLFHERMATPDIFMGALGALSLWLALQSFRRRQQWWALASGVALIGAVLAKSPVGFFFYLGPLLFFGAAWVEGQRPAWRRLALLYALPLLFAAAVFVIVGLRVLAGAYPPGFGLHEVFAKTQGDVDFRATIQENLVVLAAWLQASGNWLFALFFVIGGVLAFSRRRPHLVVLAVLVVAWFVSMTVTAASMFPERYLTPVLYLATVVAAWGMTESALALGNWGQAHPTQWNVASGILAGSMLAVLTAFMAPAALDRIVLTPTDLAQIEQEGLLAAAGYLAPRLPAEDAQVILVHVGDYTRLKAYLPPTLRGRVRQVHLVQRQSRDVNAQITYVADWAQAAAVTYVVVESAANFGPAWQASFPDAQLVAEFPIIGANYPTQVWRLGDRR